MSLIYRPGTIQEAIIVESKIPEFSAKNSESKLVERLADKQSLILIACSGDDPVAYKIGYALSDKTFYSWLGAVVPDFRKQGIATELRKRQEAWALENGFSHITVKSMNRFPAMLQMLISSGYQISGYEDKGGTETSKILFTKQLK